MSCSDRLKKMQSALALCGLSAYLVQDPTDLYYLTGLKVSTGQLLISAKGSALMLVDDRYFERAQAVMPTARSSPQKRADWLLQVASTFGHKKNKIGFDSEATSVEMHRGLVKELGQNELIAKRWSLSANPLMVKQLRSCKERGEIELLTKAAELGAAGLDFAISQLREGITEVQLARALEIFWLQRGAEGTAFAPNISFGAHSSCPHHTSGHQALRCNDLVLIDIGVRVDHYCSDITRTLFFADFPEQLPKDLTSIWQSVTNALSNALKTCRGGISIGQLDAAVRDILRQDGCEDKFTHGLGHGVGLEVHELPKLTKGDAGAKELLRSNQIITLEPGVYLRGRGGVRQEELVLIQDLDCRPLATRPLCLTHGQYKRAI